MRKTARSVRRLGLLVRATKCLPWTVVVSVLAAPSWAGHGPTPGGPAPTAPGTTPSPGCGSNVCCAKGAGGLKIDFWNGREFLTHTDLVLPGLFPITIQRSYDSQAQFDSALGYGWALNYFMRLYEYADGSVTLRRDCGVRRGFIRTANAYQTPVGETGILVKNGDGTWTYTEKSGERKQFDAQGRLVALVSPQGPYLALSYDSRGKLPLIGLSPYAVDVAPKEIAREHRLLRIDEFTGGGPTGRYVLFGYDDASGRLTGFTDSAGRTVSYQHDGNGNLTQVLLPEGGVLDYAYQDPIDPHNATALTDSGCTACGGLPYQIAYDAQDRVIEEHVGYNVMRLTYVQAYAKTILDEEVTDEGGIPLYTATSTYEFNSLGNPTKVTNPQGHQTVSFYDGNMNLTREERWENTGALVLRYVEERTYDARSNLLTLTEAKGTPQERVTTYTYDATDHLTSSRVPSVVNSGQNKVTSFTYDGLRNVLTQTESGLLGTGTPYSQTTRYTYDANGRRTSIDGPRTDVADVITLTYDGVGNLSSVTRPGSLTTSYSSYTATGQPRTVTDPNGIATIYAYDGLGRAKTVTVGGSTTSYTYTPSGKIATQTLPRNNATTYAYDALDRVISIRDGAGNTIDYSYDSAGNRTKEDLKDPGGTLQKTLSFQYDTLKRLERIVNPDTIFSEYGYDYAGNRASVKDPKGNLTTHTYDSLSRLLTTTQPGAVVTTYIYDLHDNLVSVKDAENHTNTYRYDDLGRVDRQVSPDAGTTTYTYDAAGNRTTKTDARGVTVSYRYDANNRLIQTDFPTDVDIVYTYDTCPNGKEQLCGVQDQAGTTSYSYDTKGQLTQETKVILGITYTTRYAYDGNGNLQTLTYPSGRTVSYAYDSADRVSRVTTTPLGGATQNVATGISYKPYGGVTSLTYGNGLLRSLAYDNQYRITGIQSGAVQGLSYTYDNNGNVLSQTNALNASRNKAFTYDSLDRLTSATGSWGSVGWTYDKVGNRLSQTGVEPSSYSYQAGTSRLSGISGALSKTFSYDGNGSLTLENARAYAYNQNNRLVQASEGSILGDYTQYANQQRATKTVSGVITVFHNDRQGQILAETSSGGATTIEYIHLGGQPIAKADASGLSYIHTDHLGTPQAVSNSAAAKVWEIESRPFGDGTTITGTATLNLRFPGQYADQETGLNQNWWREYDSKLGRFISADPIGYRGGLNLYRYVENKPVDRVDSSGLESGNINQLVPGPGNTPTFPWPTVPPPPRLDPSAGCAAAFAACKSRVFIVIWSLHIECEIACHALHAGVQCSAACAASLLANEVAWDQTCEVDYHKCLDQHRAKKCP